jgi:DnaJ-class molecular chaperone
MESEPKGGPEPGEPTPPPKCQRCGGVGWTRDCVPYADRDRCEECKGRGFTRHIDASGNHDQDECSWCNGTGVYRGKDTYDVGPCFGCNGRGTR